MHRLALRRHSAFPVATLLLATAAGAVSGAPSETKAAAHRAGTLDCPAGDLTGDGIVNVDDLLSVVIHGGACPGADRPCPGDADADGVVDVNDLVVVLVHYGQG